MELKDMETEATALQAVLDEKKLVHYDDVQNEMLARAAELKLTWEETRAFSTKVHELRRKKLATTNN